MHLCPYCLSEATGIGNSDEFLDFCKECDRLIEGETIEVDETTYLVAEAAVSYIQNIEEGHYRSNGARIKQALVELHEAVTEYVGRNL
jgi:hypothetical protein